VLKNAAQDRMFIVGRSEIVECFGMFEQKLGHVGHDVLRRLSTDGGRKARRDEVLANGHEAVRDLSIEVRDDKGPVMLATVSFKIEHLAGK
jgi:hypothetical protein